MQVDKAHPDVLTTLLQLFDEGRLTDGKVVKSRGPHLYFKSQWSLGRDSGVQGRNLHHDLQPCQQWNCWACSSAAKRGWWAEVMWETRKTFQIPFRIWGIPLGYNLIYQIFQEREKGRRGKERGEGHSLKPLQGKRSQTCAQVPLQKGRVFGENQWNCLLPSIFKVRIIAFQLINPFREPSYSFHEQTRAAEVGGERAESLGWQGKVSFSSNKETVL